jgi:hypothetical protein
MKFFQTSSWRVLNTFDFGKFNSKNKEKFKAIIFACMVFEELVSFPNAIFYDTSRFSFIEIRQASADID